ncbi:MAG: DNA polymerase III subunit delta [Clostridia bacterium]|nr:DNA polymerase III subunit delta [Clostridia bacterium]
MERRVFFEQVAQGKIAPCYVLEGPEEYVKRSALDALRHALLPAGMEEMNEARLTDPDANTLIAAAETLPFLAERRLVTVLESGMLQGRAKGYDEAKNAAALAEYIPNIPGTACVVFYVRDKADGRKKLYQALKKSAEIVQFLPLDEREMTRWIAQTLKKLGKQISAAACQKLTFTSGTDLFTLSGELQKLAAYAGERAEILPEDIDAVCSRTTSFRVYDLSASLLRGDAKNAFTLAAALQKDGEEPLMLLALLQGECRRLLSVKLLRAEGMSADTIAARIGAPSFAVRQLAAQVGRYTEGQLRAMADACMDTEFAVKSGRLPLEGALEKTMLQILRIRMEGKA